MVCGCFFVSRTLVTTLWSGVGLRFGGVVKTLGHTGSRISCRTNSFSARLRTLKPARSSSSAYVSVPPLLTETTFVDPETPPVVPPLLLLPPPPPPPHAASARRTAPATASAATVRTLRLSG